MSKKNKPLILNHLTVKQNTPTIISHFLLPLQAPTQAKKNNIMRLEQLRLKNIRLFGNNLQTINFSADVALSNLFTAFSNVRIKMFTDTDVRAISNTQRADYLQVGMNISNGLPNPIVIDQFKKGNILVRPLSDCQFHRLIAIH